MERRGLSVGDVWFFLSVAFLAGSFIVTIFVSRH